MNLLAVSVQFYCDGEIVDRIRGHRIRPQPKVESAVVRLVRRSEPLFATDERRQLFQGGSRRFQPSQKAAAQRAGLRNGSAANSTEQWLLTAGISSQRRAETLTLEEWCLLRDAVLREANGSPR